MKPWPRSARVDVGLDFGGGPLPLGAAATGNGRVFFQYDETFLATGLNLSPFRVKLDREVKLGSPDLEGLPGLLHDSLPDGWSRLVLDRHIRASGYDYTSLGILDRLALVGQNGPGALTYLESAPLPVRAPSIDFDTAADLVIDAPDNDDADKIAAALALTGSLGGARPKAYAFRSEAGFSTNEQPGAVPWIVKFAARSDGPEAGAVEYAYSLMAKAAGIEMPPTELLPSKTGAGFFAVKRFDRSNEGARLHLHSFGGLLNAPIAGNALGYRELLVVTGALTQPSGADISSIEQQIARMAFNVLARNRDDHVKNHAFLMTSKGEWQCAPAFDLTFSNLAEHALMVGNTGREPGFEDMLTVARHVQINDKKTREIIDRVRSAIGDWSEHAKEANVSASLAKDIGKALNPSTGAQSRIAALQLQLSRDSGHSM
jgi:serine/threonine-protein kinase HipA